MTEQTARQLTAQAHPNGAQVAVNAAMHRGFSVHITPVVTAEGHVATHVDLVVPAWDNLADLPRDEAIEVVSTFVTDVKADLEALIHNGLYESATDYILAKATGGEFKPVIRDIYERPATDPEHHEERYSQPLDTDNEED